MWLIIQDLFKPRLLIVLHEDDFVDAYGYKILGTYASEQDALIHVEMKALALSAKYSHTNRN